MSLFSTNQNRPERAARFVISLFLIPAFFTEDAGWYDCIVGSVGLILLFNAVVGTCYIYRVFGVNTCKVRQ